MMRFTVTYAVHADNDTQAQQSAEGIALEQTVEIPRDVVPAGYVEDEILGQITALTRKSAGLFHAAISYSPDSC
jgi:ribulose-bisphosphate carboxylase large chain